MNSMTLTEYQQKAYRTMLVQDELSMVEHCLMGMVGEAGELTELPFNSEKRILEIGDCMWYPAVLCTVLNFSFEDLAMEADGVLNIPTIDGFSSEVLSLLWAARATDLVKKTRFYGKELDKAKLRECMVGYMAGVLCSCYKAKLNPITAAIMNIKKLEARFPEKMFNSDHAINRDTTAEEQAANA